MPLGLNTGGDFTPFIKYNAKAGRWYVRDDDGDVEVTQDRLIFMIDFDNIEHGWIKFGREAGEAPDFALSHVSEGKPAKPSADHKSGFRVKLYSEKNLDGLREWSAASALVNGAITALYDDYEQEVGSHRGEVPVVRFLGAEPVKNKYGTNYKPKFEIIQWADRPAAFDEDADDGGDNVERSQTAAEPPPPPPPPPAAAPATANVEF